MEKFLQNLEEAEKIIRIADHLVYVTFPLLKDKRILLKLLSELKKAITNCINSILQYEYLYKRISLYQDTKANLETFKNKSAKRFNITKQELESISELFELEQSHKKSTMEFSKNDKVIILSENLNQRTISIEEIKRFLQLSKEILNKVKFIILRKI